jgi:hypothetical protein
MEAKWSDKSAKFKPQIFIKPILECSSVNANGKVQYDGFKYFENRGLLRSMILFEGKEFLSPKTEDDIFDSGLNSFALSSKITDPNLPAALLACINIKLKTYLSKSKKKFFIVTSISTNGKLPITKLINNGIEIKIHPSGIPKKFRSRNQYDKLWQQPEPHTPTEFAGVVVKAEARTPDDAMYAAIEEVDFLRGILSFFANPTMSLSLYGGKSKGINRIRLGGLHSVHSEDGVVASKQFWYEPNHTIRTPYTFNHENLKHIAMKIRKIFRRIEQIKGGLKIRDGIIRYVRALDESDNDHLIIKLWGALEATVGEGDKSDLIIKRCSYLYKDQEFVRQILEISKVYRNRNVHGNHSSSIANQLGHHLHSIFTHLILFYVGSKDLISVSEANSFLDSPLSSGDLERKIFLLKKAIRFRSGT